MREPGEEKQRGGEREFVGGEKAESEKKKEEKTLGLLLPRTTLSISLSPRLPACPLALPPLPPFCFFDLDFELEFWHKTHTRIKMKKTLKKVAALCFDLSYFLFGPGFFFFFFCTCCCCFLLAAFALEGDEE